jgi:hypothetical protein
MHLACKSSGDRSGCTHPDARPRFVSPYADGIEHRIQGDACDAGNAPALVVGRVTVLLLDRGA